MRNIFSIVLLLQIVLFAKTFNEYADINRELMLLPASIGMGGADLSLSSGATSGSSPSNLPYITKNMIHLSYANYFANAFSSSIVSFAGPVGVGGGFGITAGYLYIPDIEYTRDNQNENNNNLEYSPDIRSASDIYIRFGYGYKFNLSKNWSVGVGASVNARRNNLNEYRGYGIGMDGGLRAFHKSTGFSSVFLVENITSNYTYWSKTYKEYSYAHIRIGIGWQKEFEYLYGRINVGYTSPDLLSNEGINYYRDEKDTINSNVKIPEKKSVSKNPEMIFSNGKIGLEYTILNTVAIRTGVSQGKFNLGAGLNLFSDRAGFDFAYTRHEIAGTYQVSLFYKW
jgi:hypothetical protein